MMTYRAPETTSSKALRDLSITEYKSELVTNVRNSTYRNQNCARGCQASDRTSEKVTLPFVYFERTLSMEPCSSDHKMYG
ncbi:hypothetical protein D3C76_1569400 [compost metagenome]